MGVERLSSIESVAVGEWRGIEPADFPFFDFEFLRALESSGSIGDGSGWSPVYLVSRGGVGELLGVLCLYLKTDSYGEYIFDFDWAEAYLRNGISYYPKLVSAVPFTPATGPKLLVRPDLEARRRAEVERALMEELGRLAGEYGVSSAHALFLPKRELGAFSEYGFMIRRSLQFHWRNCSYSSFFDYLEALKSKRRRQILRERRQLEAGLCIQRLTGEALKISHARAMYRFYLATLDGKWGVPYLNGAFFEEVFRTMGDRILLVLALQEGRPVAGAINFFKGGSIYGRYWGALGEWRNLHFELCYYQEIEFAIEKGLTLFEAGAQGEHKLARGFLPSVTYSAHSIYHPAFRRAIERYIAEEKQFVAEAVDEYARHSPYRA